MRLGDLDALFRKIKNSDWLPHERINAMKMVREQPTIDAVPVVRCFECRRRYDHNECPMCFLIDGVYHEYTSGIGFCDRGERKDGEG